MLTGPPGELHTRVDAGGADDDALSPPETGFVLAAALWGDAALAEGLDANAAQRCATALARLGRLPRAARAAALARLARRSLGPLPAGIERVHASWLRDAMAGEPATLLAALVAGLPPAVAAAARALAEDAGEAWPEPPPLRPDALAELRRATLGRLSPMPERGPAARSSDELVAEIGRLGAQALGTPLAGAPRATLARATVRGLRTLRASLDDGEAVAVAQRLPLPLGRALLRCGGGRP